MQHDEFKSLVEKRLNISEKISDLMRDKKDCEGLILREIYDKGMFQYVTVNWSKLTQHVQSNRI